MIGPTGVGKTEIARRLAELAQRAVRQGRGDASSPRSATSAATSSRWCATSSRSPSTLVRDEETREGRARARERSRRGAAARSAAAAPRPQRAASADRARRRRATRATRRDAREAARACCATASSTIARSRSRSPSRRSPLLSVLGASTASTRSASTCKDMFGAFGRQDAEAPKLKVPRRCEVARSRRRRSSIDTTVDREAVARAEQAGIVFLDEIDKIARPRGAQRPRRLARGRAARPAADRRGLDGDHEVRPGEDRPRAVHRGRRVPHRASRATSSPSCRAASRSASSSSRSPTEDFVRILTEPQNALTQQYAALLATEGVTLEFTDDGDRRDRAHRRRGQRAHREHRRAPFVHAVWRSCSRRSPSRPRTWRA